MRSISETTTKQNPKLLRLLTASAYLVTFPVHRIQYFCDKEGYWSDVYIEIAMVSRKGLSLDRKVWKKPDETESNGKK